MLKITTEGRKAALDLRLMKPGLPDDPQSKVNLAVENIHRIWEATKDDRLRAACFLRPVHASRPWLFRLS
jgi:hypothetical protein